MDREEVLSNLRERIIAFAASRLSRDAAEDLAQEVLIVLHEKYGDVTRIEELVPLALRIVRFKILALHRKAVRRGEHSQISIDEIQLSSGEGNPLSYVERKELLERLAGAMAKLGERCRQLIRWKLEGKSFAEIQSLLGVRSINTIYTWDFRCRKRLLELMGGSWEIRK